MFIWKNGRKEEEMEGYIIIFFLFDNFHHKAKYKKNIYIEDLSLIF